MQVATSSSTRIAVDTAVRRPGRVVSKVHMQGVRITSTARARATRHVSMHGTSAARMANESKNTPMNRKSMHDVCVNGNRRMGMHAVTTRHGRAMTDTGARVGAHRAARNAAERRALLPGRANLGTDAGAPKLGAGLRNRAKIGTNAGLLHSRAMSGTRASVARRAVLLHSRAMIGPGAGRTTRQAVRAHAHVKRGTRRQGMSMLNAQAASAAKRHVRLASRSSCHAAGMAPEQTGTGNQAREAVSLPSCFPADYRREPTETCRGL